MHHNWVYLVVFCFLTADLHCAAKEVKFSVERGFFDAPFTLNLTYSGGSVIRYTIGNGAIQPTNSTGTIYSGPFTISKTTVVFAMGYDPDTKISSLCVASSYIFLNDIISSSVMRTAITTNPIWGPMMKASLMSLPTWSITMNQPPILPDNEKPINVEWIPIDGSPSYSYPAGAEVYGGASRSFAKNSLKFQFRARYGQKNFKGDLFKGYDTPYSAVKEFDSMSIRAGSQDSVFGNFQASYVKNIWHDWLMKDIGHMTPHARFVHVYLNTEYRGVFHMREREVTRMLESYLGSNNSDYEELNTGTKFHSPAWDRLLTQESDWNYVRQWIDQQHFMDFMVVVHYGGNYDMGPQKNWQAAGPAKSAPWMGAHSGFKFFHNDEDYTMDWGNVPGLDVTNTGIVDNLFLSLMATKHVDFLQLFQDRVYYLLQREDGSGHLQPTYVNALFQRIIKEVNISLVAESARWGTAWTAQPNPGNWTLEAWYYHINGVLTKWVPFRPAVVVGQYRKLGWLSSYNVPLFSLQDRSTNPPGTVLTITNVNSSVAGASIVYTTDGSDPRLQGGTTNPSAAVVSTSTVTVTLSTTTIVNARVKVGTSWSPLQCMTFIITNPCTLCNNIIISEIHYHPNTSLTPQSRIQFVEIQNIGSTSQNLLGAYFSGIEYVFPNVVLPPGEFYVIARAYEEFHTFYSRTPNCTHWGALSKKGENITLFDVLGNIVFSVTYDNNLPWAEISDHMSYSLVPRNLSTLLSNTTNVKQWRASAAPNGSPFQADPPMPPSRAVTLVINELATAENQTSVEWIELFNPTTQTISLYNWALTDSFRKDKYRSKDISIGPGQYLVLNSTELGYRLDDEGGDVYLFGAICCRLDKPTVPSLSGEFVGQKFGASLPGLTVGRYVASDGTVHFIMMETRTEGAANSKPYIGNVLITSVAAQASGAYAGGEYVRITSVSTSTINLAYWELKVGKKSVNGDPFVFPSITLDPKESLYIIKTTDVQFKTMYNLPIETKVLIFSNTTWNLLDKITLSTFINKGNGSNYTVSVESVNVTEVLGSIKKRQTPTIIGITRNEQTLGYSGDPQFWTTFALPVAPPLAPPVAGPVTPPVPIASPVAVPVTAPTTPPTVQPVPPPSAVPTKAPSTAPTTAPTTIPTSPPTSVPTRTPMSPPVTVPSSPPTVPPTPQPVSPPTVDPLPNAPIPEPVSAPLPTNETSDSSGGFPMWAIAVIVVGALLLIGIVIFGIYSYQQSSLKNWDTV